MKKLVWFPLFVLFIFASGCSIQGDGLPEIDSSVCNGQVPIVMAHGFLASGDTYEKQAQRFIANGICPERIFMFDWNSLGAQNNTQRLSAFIQKILLETGEDKVFLMGHSAGSGLGYGLLKYSQQSEMVAKYIHLAGVPQSKPAGPGGNIPTLNIYSDADPIASGGDIPGAVNLNLINKDHYEVATSLETFIAMYEFLYEESPATIDLYYPGDEIGISGKAVSFGENLPGIGASIKIYELDPATGFRLTTDPQFSLMAGAHGFWGPVDVKRDTYYEFVVTTNKPGDRPVHYYREPFRFPDNHVYLRTYPPLLSLGSVFLNGIPRSDDMATVAFFGASQAAVSGRDILKVNGIELSTPELTSAEQSTIAMFLYDRGDGISTYAEDQAFAAFPFLSGVDAFFPTTVPQTITMEFNGRTLKMRNWPSASDGVSVAVFN